MYEHFSPSLRGTIKSVALRPRRQLQQRLFELMTARQRAHGDNGSDVEQVQYLSR